MSWETTLKKESKVARDIRAFIGILEKEVDNFLNRNVFDESDYTEEKLKQLQEDVDSGEVLAGLGRFLKIELSLDADGFYIDVAEKDGTEIVSFQFDSDGKLKRRG